MRVGLFCLDPGVSTGIAWAVVDTNSNLAADAMRTRKRTGSTTIQGTPMQQAMKIHDLWESYLAGCVKESIPCHLISEEFVLSPMSSASGRDATMPERVMWAFEGYRHGKHSLRRSRHLAKLVLQRSGAASRYNSQAMLKPVAAWIRGKEHERSAFAHMYLYTASLLDRHPRGRG